MLQLIPLKKKTQRCKLARIGQKVKIKCHLFVSSPTQKLLIPTKTFHNGASMVQGQKIFFHHSPCLKSQEPYILSFMVFFEKLVTFFLLMLQTCPICQCLTNKQKQKISYAADFFFKNKIFSNVQFNLLSMLCHFEDLFSDIKDKQKSMCYFSIKM